MSTLVLAAPKLHAHAPAACQAPGSVPHPSIYGLLPHPDNILAPATSFSILQRIPYLTVLDSCPFTTLLPSCLSFPFLVSRRVCCVFISATHARPPLLPSQNSCRIAQPITLLSSPLFLPPLFPFCLSRQSWLRSPRPRRHHWFFLARIKSYPWARAADSLTRHLRNLCPGGHIGAAPGR